jgi:hypothetical protein
VQRDRQPHVLAQRVEGRIDLGHAGEFPVDDHQDHRELPAEDRAGGILDVAAELEEHTAHLATIPPILPDDAQRKMAHFFILQKNTEPGRR